MAEADDGTVYVSFQLSAAEYGAAIQRLCWTLWPFRGLAGLSVLAIVAGFGFALAGDVSLSLTLLGVGAVWLVLLAWMFLGRPRTQFARQKRLREEQRHCFGDADMTVSLTDAESRVKWTFFDEIIETKDLYRLRHQRFCNVIPKRAFASRDEESRFRQLARQHTKVDFRP